MSGNNRENLIQTTHNQQTQFIKDQSKELFHLYGVLHGLFISNVKFPDAWLDCIIHLNQRFIELIENERVENVSN